MASAICTLPPADESPLSPTLEKALARKTSERTNSSGQAGEDGSVDDALSNASTADNTPKDQDSPLGVEMEAPAQLPSITIERPPADDAAVAAGSPANTAEATSGPPLARPAAPAVVCFPPRPRRQPQGPALLGSPVQASPEDLSVAASPFVLPRPARRVRVSVPDTDAQEHKAASTPPPQAAAPSRGSSAFCLATPSSCASAAYRYVATPRTPDPARADFRLVTEDVKVVFFDFDGTLTETPGEMGAHHLEKKRQLKERSQMLIDRLQALRDVGMLIGIISKSTETTIRDALQEAGINHLFNGPIIGKAVGFEGKAGFISDLSDSGALGSLEGEPLQQVLLIDDDVRELERARQAGIQTFAAPQEGGLQEEDFDELFCGLGLLALPSSTPPPREGGRALRFASLESLDSELGNSAACDV